MGRFVRLAGCILLVGSAWNQNVFALTIPDAKLLADESPVSLTAKAVTYVAADFFYIEEDSRCMGIRVEKAAHELSVGMRADVSGTMKPGTNRERYILASDAVHNGDAVVGPVGMNNAGVGGGDWSVSGTRGQRGATGSLGLNNIGLLIRTWGRFQQVDATTFTVDDGAGLNVRCSVAPGTFLYSGWQYVSVVGASSLYKFNASIYPPLILVRDIEVLLPVETVSTPGVPVGDQSPLIDVSYTYSTGGSTCSQGHTVEYSFDWGDGASSPWSTSTSASHSWSVLGTKTVTVAARCQIHTTVAATSAGLAVNMTDIGAMIYIPAGSFLMGNSGVGYDATYVRSDELPQHSVYLSDYHIGKYEVTRGQYRQFMDAGGYSNSAYWSTDGWTWKGTRTEPACCWAAQQSWGSPPGSFTQTDNHPVVGVTYYEAEAFCNWAGGHLPTEAQWEKAARWTGSYPNVYPWGDTWDVQKCNNWDDSLYPRYQTAPVGRYPSGASPYGCQDMAGNAEEWCKDWYRSDYYSQTPPGGWIDPQGPSTAIWRVSRGGTWHMADSSCRCACRDDCYYPDYSSSLYGFRLAR